MPRHGQSLQHAVHVASVPQIDQPHLPMIRPIAHLHIQLCGFLALFLLPNRAIHDLIDDVLPRLDWTGGQKLLQNRLHLVLHTVRLDNIHQILGHQLALLALQQRLEVHVQRIRDLVQELAIGLPLQNVEDDARVVLLSWQCQAQYGLFEGFPDDLVQDREISTLFKVLYELQDPDAKLIPGPFGQPDAEDFEGMLQLRLAVGLVEEELDGVGNGVLVDELEHEERRARFLVSRVGDDVVEGLEADDGGAVLVAALAGADGFEEGLDAGDVLDVFGELFGVGAEGERGEALDDGLAEAGVVG